MLRSMYSGISGMKVNQVKLDVIGNNIANVGTTAFKGSRVRFQDMISQNMNQALAPGLNQGGTNPRQVGLGVQVGGIDTMVGQGMMQPTSRNLDVAVDGDGYFMVSRGKTHLGDEIPVTDSIIGATNEQIMFTRDGSFTLDSDGNLLTSDGYRVLGYDVTSGGKSAIESDGKQGKINFIDADSNDLKASGGLKTLVIPDKVTVPFDEAAAKKAVDTATTVKTDADTAAIAAATALAANSTDTSLVAADADAKAKALAAANDLTKATAILNGKEGKEVRIRTFTIEKDGQIKAILENGKVSVLGQIAMASFKNPAGLEKAGKNLMVNTSNSGEAVIKSGVGADKDNSKGYGEMLQGMLEMSNVDLAEQFTDMIVASRAFQASGKTITTGDEILQDIINLKR